MKINNLSQINQSYIDKQSNSRITVQKEVAQRKNGAKKIIATLAGLGVIAVGSVLVVNKLKKGKATDIQLSDIELKNKSLNKEIERRRCNEIELKRTQQKNQAKYNKIFDEKLSNKNAQESAEVFSMNDKEKIDLIPEEMQEVLSIPKNTQNIEKIVKNLDEIGDFNQNEYYNSKAIILEQIKKNARKCFDEKDIDLIKTYKNCTYDDLDKVLQDANKDDLGKLWLCAKGNLEKKGSSVLIDEIPDIFQNIPENTLVKSIDNFVSSGIVNGHCKIGDKIFKIEYINSGTYSSVVKISDGVNKPVVLKYAISANDNAYCNEILLARHLKNAGVVDVPRFYMANPITEKWQNIENGCNRTRCAWQILDYVTQEQKIPDGKKLFDYLKEVGGKHFDQNSGMYVGDFIVDLGGIRGNRLPRPYSSFVCDVAPNISNGITLEELCNVLA